jgi:hypothetical protein
MFSQTNNSSEDHNPTPETTQQTQSSNYEEVNHLDNSDENPGHAIDYGKTLGNGHLSNQLGHDHDYSDRVPEPINNTYI